MDQHNIKSVSESQAAPPSATPDNYIDTAQRTMVMKTIYYDEWSTRPNPVTIASIRKDNMSKNGFTRTISSNIFQSFMDQYWEDLPQNLSPAQVVDEIIATFQ